MKKLLLLLGLLAAAAAASGQTLYCGMAGGWNLNVTDATDSYRCGPVALTRGTKPITTSSGSGTVTSDGAFVFDASGAAPSVGNLSTMTGLVVEGTDGLRYWFQVTAKATASSITVATGTGTPSITGTWPIWSWWQTSCVRSGSPCGTFNVASTSPLLWGTLDSGSRPVHFRSLFTWVYSLTGTSTTVTNQGYWQAPWAKNGGGEALESVTSSATPEAQAFVQQGTTPRPVSAGGTFQICTNTLGANAAYLVSCFVRTPISDDIS